MKDTQYLFNIDINQFTLSFISFLVAMSVKPAFIVSFYRVNSDKGWLKFRNMVRMECDQFSFIFREVGSHQLVADCPYDCVNSIEFLEETLFNTVQCHSNDKIAFKFQSFSDMNSFHERLTLLQINLKVKKLQRKDTVPMPSLDGKDVEQLILKLLVSDEFYEFAEQLRQKVESLEKKFNL